MSAEISADRRSVPRLVGGAMGLAAFAVAVLSGMHAQNAGSTIVLKALVALAAGNIIGTGFGMVAEALLKDHARRYAERVSSETPALNAPGAEPAPEAAGDPIDEQQPETPAKAA
ncbi:MAG: hypothetical protein AAGF47_00055 [Planctomycetota bacterium]